MLTLVRFIGRRLFLSQSKKFRLISRLVTFVGLARLTSRAITPVRRIVLARDESMEIRITKTGRHTS
ncbi:MAG: hypothetical protein NTZ62_08920 [Actinobacteria bacterium]|nr:hypothetical protein [Actinomycetota bacterium]